VKPKVANPMALAVLALLGERPMHPYEMIAKMRERRQDSSMKVRYSSVYSVVEAMERAGLIVAAGTARAGKRPEHTVYAITEAGTRERGEWLRALLSTPATEYPAYITGLSFLPALETGEAVALLEERIAHLTALGAKWRTALDKARADGIPPLALVESDYRLFLQEQEIDWTRDLIEKLRAGALPFDEETAQAALHARRAKAKRHGDEAVAAVTTGDAKPDR
jgi:DNA-binding PadR family transcriptional regulator